MSAWRHLAERLVEIDFAIEDLDGWATAPDDVAELERLEELRDDILTAVARRRIPVNLRDRLSADDLAFAPDVTRARSPSFEAIPSGRNLSRPASSPALARRPRSVC